MRETLRVRRLLPLLCATALVSVPGFAAAAPVHAVRAPLSAVSAGRVHRKTASTQLTNIVVLIQENRTTDNLYNGFCVNATICADTVTVDPYTNTPLTQTSLAAPFDPPHAHSTFVTEVSNGMTGFQKIKIKCKGSLCPPNVYVYAPATETAIYRQMATFDGELSDETFQTDSGPSFPSHLYAIGGQSGGYDDDHWAIDSGSGNCATTEKKSTQIDMTTPFPGQQGNKTVPCKDFETIFDLLANAGKTWRYYSDSASGFFSATQAIQHLYGSPNFVVGSTKFLKDASKHKLADVSFVIPPSEKESDHPGNVPSDNPEAGPQWIASVVNAIGESKYWNSTAIVIWWDDWGGLYDHVMPPVSPVNPDPFEYGFRVPLVVLSPYAIVGSIDHTPRTFVSALRLIEETYNLPSLGTTDQYEPDGLDSMFNYNQAPTPFTPLGGSNARSIRMVQ
jgi:phospholipase C